MANFKSMKEAQLVEKARRRKLRTSGNRLELIERLQHATQHPELEEAELEGIEHDTEQPTTQYQTEVLNLNVKQGSDKPILPEDLDDPDPDNDTWIWPPEAEAADVLDGSATKKGKAPGHNSEERGEDADDAKVQELKDKLKKASEAIKERSEVIKSLRAELATSQKNEIISKQMVLDFATTNEDFAIMLQTLSVDRQALQAQIEERIEEKPPPTAAEVVTSIHGEADRNEAAEIEALFRPPPEPLDSTKSAYLGEADSNDFVEAEDAVNPRKQEALDASVSAYLGEADSNNAVESERVINPRVPEPVDPTSSAFLGESGEQDAYDKP
ncbi:hypothetical protein H2201_005804 [Coniosporium apollinis]|uniref:SAP domain-containing protein n=1 Tax=Coniosporium apollinis TaxID=61459 RepID=A0ABQ9NS97_9PEZI|nr:hypothetical protein H2201_005804 [Coniosporium apollinis]